MSDVMQSAWAEAFANPDFICIETYSGYRSSCRDQKGKQFLLPTDATDLALGSAAQDALACSRFVTPLEDPTLFDYQINDANYENWALNLMSVYKYQNKRDLFKKMSNCSLVSRGGSIVIRPTNHDRLEGWSADGISEKDHLILNAEADPQLIGSSLRMAFARCIV